MKETKRKKKVLEGAGKWLWERMKEMDARRRLWKGGRKVLEREYGNGSDSVRLDVGAETKLWRGLEGNGRSCRKYYSGTG